MLGWRAIYQQWERPPPAQVSASSSIKPERTCPLTPTLLLCSSDKMERFENFQTPSRCEWLHYCYQKEDRSQPKVFISEVHAMPAGGLYSPVLTRQARPPTHLLVYFDQLRFACFKNHPLPLEEMEFSTTLLTPPFTFLLGAYRKCEWCFFYFFYYGKINIRCTTVNISKCTL